MVRRFAHSPTDSAFCRRRFCSSPPAAYSRARTMHSDPHRAWRTNCTMDWCREAFNGRDWTLRRIDGASSSSAPRLEQR